MRVLKKDRVYLPCKLTDEEFKERASSLAAVLEDIKSEESRHDMLKTEMKSALAALEARRDLLALTVSRRSESRETEVRTEANDAAGIVERIRMDTGEVISSRAMADDERQLPLPV